MSDISDKIAQLDRIMRTNYRYDTGLAIDVQGLVWGCKDEEERLRLLAHLVRDCFTLEKDGEQSGQRLGYEGLGRIRQAGQIHNLAESAVWEMREAKTSEDVAKAILKFSAVIGNPDERAYLLYQVLNDPRSPIPFHDMGHATTCDLGPEDVELILRHSGASINKMALMARCLPERYGSYIAGAREIEDILDGMLRSERVVAIAQMLAEVHRASGRGAGSIIGDLMRSAAASTTPGCDCIACTLKRGLMEVAEEMDKREAEGQPEEDASPKPAGKKAGKPKRRVVEKQKKAAKGRKQPAKKGKRR